MNTETVERSHVSGPSAVERCVSSLAEAEKYLRDEADFNRSWTDGRRGADQNPSAEYTARRLEVARQRAEWADAIAFVSTKLAANVKSEEAEGGPAAAGSLSTGGLGDDYYCPCGQKATKEHACPVTYKAATQALAK